MDQTPEYDDSEWTLDEMRQLAARAFEDADNAGPIPGDEDAPAAETDD